MVGGAWRVFERRGVEVVSWHETQWMEPKGEGEDGSPPDTKNGRSGEGEGAAPG